MSIAIKNGTTTYYNTAGRYHRICGPAIEYANGTKHWYLNGKLHRVDGPAIEYADGRKDWYLDGKLHRVDGPAIEHADGRKHWYLNGKFIRSESATVTKQSAGECQPKNKSVESATNDIIHALNSYADACITVEGNTIKVIIN